MYEFVNSAVRVLKNIIPPFFIRPFLPSYHRMISLLMALSYGFPARKLVVIGVTGTKGKSTTAEMLFAILREAGYKTALISTIRFAINDDSEPNLYKMTLPGRGFTQAFMRKAIRAGCTHLVIEVTSESVLQFRHWFLSLDGLIVTNIHKEHVESHGSFENYVGAKRAIVNTLVTSTKQSRILVVNADIKETREFLTANVSKSILVLKPIPFSINELQNISLDERSVHFKFDGQKFDIPIAGIFNAMNALASVKICKEFGVSLATSSIALSKLPIVSGRVEHIEMGQDFLVIVDYAHTPDSLEALYSVFQNRRKICVLGNTGGGRDKWKRPEMGKIADKYCETVILTNEDPYDEDPESIVDAMASAMGRTPQKIMDRRDAIRFALQLASLARDAHNTVVLITGKGTDPFIMKANGVKTPWSDANVVREELERLLREV